MSSPMKPWNRPRSEKPGSASRPAPSGGNQARFNAVPEFQRAAARRPVQGRPPPRQPEPPLQLPPALAAAADWLRALPLSARLTLGGAVLAAAGFSQCEPPEARGWAAAVTLSSHLSVLATLVRMLRGPAPAHKLFHIAAGLGCLATATSCYRTARRELGTAGLSWQQWWATLKDRWAVWALRLAEPVLHAVQLTLHLAMLLKASAAGAGEPRLPLPRWARALVAVAHIGMGSVALTGLTASAREAVQRADSEAHLALVGSLLVGTGLWGAALRTTGSPQAAIGLPQDCASLGAAILLGGTPSLMVAHDCPTARSMLVTTLCNGWSAFMMAVLQS